MTRSHSYTSDHKTAQCPSRADTFWYIWLGFNSWTIPFQSSNVLLELFPCTIFLFHQISYLKNSFFYIQSLPDYTLSGFDNLIRYCQICDAIHNVDGWQEKVKENVKKGTFKFFFSVKEKSFCPLLTNRKSAHSHQPHSLPHTDKTTFKRNNTRDFFFISNEKDTKCIKMLFTDPLFSPFQQVLLRLTCAWKLRWFV